MERCDFSSVISIIRKYISESREINQTDLLYELFDTFIKDSQNIDYVFDNGLVCRWFKGVSKISPQIAPASRTYYESMNLSQSRTSVCGCFFVKKQSICSQCVYALFTIQWLCKVVSKLTQFMTTDTALSAYMAYPKFLLEMIDLGETAKLIYIVLLDRARISQAKDGWTDENGNVFIFYPIQDLAKAIHKSEMSVKTALAALEDHALLLRRRQGVGKANRIYVKLPVDRNLSARQTENCPSDGKKTVCHMERKLSGNKNKESKTNKSRRRSKAYGKFQNVFLSDGDITVLQRTVPSYIEYIERLSAYMQSTGKNYADHAATIRSWYDRDNPPPPARNYESEENESL